MENNIILNPKTILLSYVFLFLCTSVFPSVKLMPAIEVLAVQVILSLVSFTIIASSYKMNTSYLLSCIFVVHITLSFLTRYLYVSFFNNPLGPIAVDSLAYNVDAQWLCKYGLVDSLSQCLKAFDIDDIGFTYILYLVYSLFGPSVGIHFMLIVNSIAVVLTCYYFHRLLKSYIPKSLGNVIIAIYGTSAYSIITSANGLKENFFVFIIVLSVYRLLLYYKYGGISNLVILLCASSICLFFRLALFPVFWCAIISAKILPRIKFTTINSIFLGLLLLALIYQGSSVFQYLFILRGLSENVVEDMYDLQYGTNSFSSSFNILLSTLFGIIGSVPSFISSPDKISYITIPNSTSLISIMCGSLLVTGVFKSLKYHHPFSMLSVIYILNTLMVIMMSFSFDFRYRFVIFPLILSISAYSLLGMSINERRFHSMYVVGITAVILLYNFKF